MNADKGTASKTKDFSRLFCIRPANQPRIWYDSAVISNKIANVAKNSFHMTSPLAAIIPIESPNKNGQQSHVAEFAYELK